MLRAAILYELDLFHVSIAGVPFDSCQAFLGYRTTAHHAYAFQI